MNAKDVRRIWLYLGELWPSYRLPDPGEMTDIREQGWLRQLGDVSIEVVQVAVDSLARREFAPTIGQIREAVDAMVIAGSNAGAPDVDEAWGEVKRAVASHGASREPQWRHPAISAAVQAMDWRAFCRSDVAAESTWRAHFIKFYGKSQVRTESEAGIGPAPVVAALAARLSLEGPRAALAIGVSSSLTQGGSER